MKIDRLPYDADDYQRHCYEVRVDSHSVLVSAAYGVRVACLIGVLCVLHCENGHLQVVLAYRMDQIRVAYHFLVDSG